MIQRSRSCTAMSPRPARDIQELVLNHKEKTNKQTETARKQTEMFYSKLQKEEAYSRKTAQVASAIG